MGDRLADNDVAPGFDALRALVCLVDRRGVVSAVNTAWDSFARDNGAAQAAGFLGSNYLEICRRAEGPASDEAGRVFAGLRAVLAGQRDLFEIEYPCHAPDHKRWFRACITPRWRRGGEYGGEPLGAVVSHLDITDRKAAEQEFARLIAADPLTGLPDRRFFAEAAHVEIELAHRFGKRLALLLIEPDNLREIRDSFGEPAEQDVLRSVALRGRARFGAKALFALAGRRQFVCLASGDAANAVAAANALRAEFESLPLTLWSRVVSVTASVGVTMLDPEESGVGGALFRAEAALCQAQAAGGGRVKSLMKRPTEPEAGHFDSDLRATSHRH